MRASISKALIGLVLLVVVIAALLPMLAPRPPEVETHRVQRAALATFVGDEGETRVKELYIVSAPIAGQMRRVEIEPGDPVVAGKTVLTHIEAIRPRFFDLRETTEHRARVDSAKAQRDLAAANVSRCEAELALALSDLKRNKELVAKGATSDRTLESAQIEVRVKRAELIVARSTLAAKEAEIEVAKSALLQAPEDAGEEASSGPPASPVLAPVTGVLLRREHESEGIVKAGEPLFEIGAGDDLEVVVELTSEDAVQVQPGDAALLDGWGGDAVLDGVVRRIEPYGFTKVSALGIEEQRVNVIIDFTDPEDASRHLGHGYRVDVSIRIWEADEVLRIPIGALFRDRNQWATFVVDRTATARLRRLEIGHIGEHFAEVLDGLAAGDEVVLHPSDRIVDAVLVARRGERQ